MKFNFSQVMACELEEALATLAKYDFQVDAIETSPPGKKSGKGAKRIIAIRDRSEVVKVIWSYENYE